MRRLLPSVAAFGFVMMLLIGFSWLQPMQGPDRPGCNMSYMSPAYSRVVGFDESHTKYASKYSLYLYREEGSDPFPPSEDDGFQSLDGVPMLFIPGNAGSFRQVRSLAAELADAYFHDYRHHPDDHGPTKNFDVYTADFNEDFTAFHGRTMLDQAEYLNEAVAFILSLYADHPVPPTSVVVVGHSMGGVVARTMVTLPSYRKDSVNTIVTLASPHAASPLTFDGDLIRLYSSIDRFWYDGYGYVHDDFREHPVAQQRLANVSLVSITGGGLDDTLPADYTTLGYLVPPTHGFTVYSTGIPSVWTPIDHLAIVWCDQLRRKLARTLLDIVDVERPQRTLPLEERMTTFRRNLLSGFEAYAMQDKAVYQSETFEFTRDRVADSAMLVVDPSKKAEPGMRVTAFKIEPNSVFSLLSSIPPTAWLEFIDKGYINPTVLVCRAPKDDDSSEVRKFGVDTGTDTITQRCRDVSLDFNMVPRSGKPLRESSRDQPYYAMHYNSSSLAGWDHVVVIDRLAQPESHFLVAQLYDQPESYVLKSSMASLLWGQEIVLPANRPMTVDVSIPGAWSSIMAYTVITRPVVLQETSSPFFPLIRQWSDEPYESKWYVEEHQERMVLTKHGIAPFTPFKVVGNPDQRGLNLQIWQADTSGSLLVSCRLNWSYFLRLLVLRYRLALVAICVSVTLAVIVFQIRAYSTSKRWPPFTQAMANLTSWPILPLVVVVLSVMTPLFKMRWVQRMFDLVDPVVLSDANDVNISLRRDYRLNSFYLGLEESMLWFLGPVFFSIGMGLVYFSAQLIAVVGGLLGWFFRKTPPTTEKTVEATSEPPKTEPAPATAVVVESTWWQWLWHNRRVVATLLVLVSVAVYLPYPVVYILCVVVQVFKVGRYACVESVSNYNYQSSLLVLMLWVLPVNIPILVVFVHNVAVKWSTPFSSHHNILSILPVLVVTRMRNIPNFGKNRFTQVVVAYLLYCIVYCVVYGVRHTFWIHHLVNFLCCLLIFGFVTTTNQ
ncbi:GPI inositol-deacylase [Diutina catenulata]